MISIFCAWGGDLAIGPTGDLAVNDIQSEINARVLRRLITNSGEYIWHSDYGSGLGKEVGKLRSEATLRNMILGQLSLEPWIATTPPASVKSVAAQDNASTTESVRIGFSLKYAPAIGSIAVNLDL